MKRLLMALVVLASMIVVPSALADSGDECEPAPPPEGSIELGTRQKTYTYTVTLEEGIATATLGNDDCSLGRGSVTVGGVTIPAPTQQGERTSAELGFVEAGTYTYSVTVTGRISVWLLIESAPSFDGLLECGQSTTSVGDGDATPMATFTRGADDDSEGKNSDPCSKLIGYNLDSAATSSEQTVSFEFETSEFPSWFGEFTWTSESASMPVAPTELDLDGDGTSDGDLQWCVGFSGTDPEAMEPLPVLPSGESWCLISQSSTLVGAGEIQVTQTIYGVEDPNFIRPK